MNKRTDYRNYLAKRDRWKNKGVRVRCPACGVELNFGDFERHASDEHLVNSKYSCPYCFGKKRWCYGETGGEDVNRHRLDCMERFCEKNRPVPEPGEKFYDFVPSFGEPSSQGCKKCDRYLRNGRLPRQLNGRKAKFKKSFYEKMGDESLFTKKRYPDHVVFNENSGLGSWAFAIFRLFREMDFYHLMVKQIVWDRFEKEMTRFKGIHFTPCWCLCDGRKDGETEGFHHRHAIVAVDRKSVRSFQTLWSSPKIKTGTGEKVKLMKKITTLQHLTNAVFYVGNDRGHCEGNLNLNRQGEGSHYWINAPLYPHAKLALSSLWRGGMDKFLTVMLNRVSPWKWYKNVEVNARGEWTNKVQVRWLDIDIKRCYLPFASFVKPGETIEYKDLPPNRPFIHLFGDRVLALDVDVDWARLSYDEWVDHQLRAGNSFLGAIGYAPLVPNKVLVMHVNNLLKLDKITEQLKRTIDFNESSMKESNVRIENLTFANTWLTNENDRLTKSNKQFANYIRDLTKTNSSLVNEAERSKTEIVQLKSEIVKLKNVQLENENALLKKENAELKCEIAELKKEIAELKKENAELKRKCFIYFSK